MKKLTIAAMLIAGSAFAAPAADAKPAKSQPLHDCVGSTHIEYHENIWFGIGTQTIDFIINVKNKVTGQSASYEARRGDILNGHIRFTGDGIVYRSYNVSPNFNNSTPTPGEYFTLLDVYAGDEVARNLILNTIAPREFCSDICQVGIRFADQDAFSVPAVLSCGGVVPTTGNPLTDLTPNL